MASGCICDQPSLLGVSARGNHDRMRSQMATERSWRSHNSGQLVVRVKRFLKVAARRVESGFHCETFDSIEGVFSRDERLPERRETPLRSAKRSQSEFGRRSDRKSVV